MWSSSRQMLVTPLVGVRACVCVCVAVVVDKQKAGGAKRAVSSKERLSSSSSDDELTASQKSLLDVLGELPTTLQERAEAIVFRRQFKVRPDAY